MTNLRIFTLLALKKLARKTATTIERAHSSLIGHRISNHVGEIAKMWKTEMIYLIIKTKKFKWFSNVNNKIPFLYQILHVSQLHHDIIEKYDIKYLCLNFEKSVEKNKVGGRNFKSMIGSETTTIQFREVTWLIHRKKVSRNTFVADLLKIKVKKWNRLKLPMLFEVTSSDDIFKFWVIFDKVMLWVFISRKLKKTKKNPSKIFSLVAFQICNFPLSLI